ncbi:KUP/HAK/KT family potassium transporter [Ligilactobacillus ceti]|uniref:Probable potassium transport system protein Kup n=1 Tax=Ligilactobacillus ceti DSM 22408 TaxID=1122146 RepID=A0A0R2KJJ1_9LACO|nr:KUP/HAK/KT family potassium transporter [Ligilactobacillus ceti]KRN89554.1 potassium transporter [Ligilactobacillus ceti DSM 22408]
MDAKALKRISFAGMLVSLGIVYGDIGTSPLYTMNAIINYAGGLQNTTPEYVIGSISLIFWTLMLVTTIKYVIIAMQADNHNEGGIFALYALVRHRAKWLVIPALIGGAALLADGTLTPAVTVTSAIEGLKGQQFGPFSFSHNQGTVLIIVTIILLILFMVQRFGTGVIGRSFGPIMILWFGFLAVGGIINISAYPQVFSALLPHHAIMLLVSPYNKAGIFILGGVFLATTGAEALYSDMGHVGKKNIYATWPFVYAALILNYLGQGAWMITHAHDAQFASSQGVNPFYSMLPDAWRLPAIAIAAMAAIIASQALITGSYTLVSEAIGLKFLPKMVIKHPSNVKNQIYIGTVNWLLCIITLGVVWFFRSSEHMEAAYGLAITITMLMTTLLLFEYIAMKLNRVVAFIIAAFFFMIESVFFLASIAKFVHGGYVTCLILFVILAVMYIWYFGNKRRESYEGDSEYVSLLDYCDQLEALSQDETIPLYSTNVVYMTKIKNDYEIKRNTMYSILDKGPKRAKVYWFVTVNETDEPFESTYTVDMMGTNNIVNVQLYLGFRRTQSVSVYLHQIIDQLTSQGILEPQNPKYSTMKNRKVGGFKFIIITEEPADLSNSPIKTADRRLIASRIFLQNITASPVDWFGLEFSNVVEETSPLFIALHKDTYLVQRKIYHTTRASRKEKDDNLKNQ